MKEVLIVQGGWEGHKPVPVSETFRRLLEKEGFKVEISDHLDAFSDVGRLKQLHLIIPVWTMGKITGEQLDPIIEAVALGVGIARVPQGGMCDSFRECVSGNL